MRPSVSAQARRSRANAGFTLVEALAALAIAGVLLAIIAEFAGRTLANWSRGHRTIAIVETVTRGLARMELDLSGIVPMSLPGGDGNTTYFAGDQAQIVFVSATGFAPGHRGVELLHFSVDRDGDDTVVVRTRGLVLNPPPRFSDPVQIFRGPMKVRFYFLGRDGKIVESWNGRPDIPQAVMVDIKSANGAPVFASAFTLPVRVNFSADCLGDSGTSTSTGGGTAPANSQAGNAPANGNPDAGGDQAGSAAPGHCRNSQVTGATSRGAVSSPSSQ